MRERVVAYATSVPRSTRRATRASVGAVALDRVVGERVDYPAGTDERAVAGILVYLVLADFNHRLAGIGPCACVDAVAAVAAYLAGPDARHCEAASRGCVCQNAVAGVEAEDAVACGALGGRLHVQAIAALQEGAALNREFGRACASVSQGHPVPAASLDYGVHDADLSEDCRVQVHEDAGAREILNEAVYDVHRLPGH